MRQATCQRIARSRAIIPVSLAAIVERVSCLSRLDYCCDTNQIPEGHTIVRCKAPKPEEDSFGTEQPNDSGTGAGGGDAWGSGTATTSVGGWNEGGAAPASNW